MRKYISAITVIMLCCGIAASAQNPDAAKLNAYFDTLGRNNRFMGSVSVFRDGAEIYKKSVGFTDIDKPTAATEKSQYSIGSISKTFTAAMIFQAVDEGKLSLSQTIDRFFPSIPNADKITIAHLLAHRSGIHNFTSDKTYFQWNTEDKTKDEMLGIITEGGTDFEPDSTFAYCNSNYVLLSYILESVDGKPYAQILTERITAPLSLKDTYFGVNDRSESYKNADGWKIERKTNPSITLGAGGIVSTPADLNRFADALFNGKVVSTNSLSIMQTLKDNWGMGLVSVPFHSERGYGHGGNVDGFQSMFIYFPKGRISCAITSNGMNYALNDINIAVLSGVYGMPFDVPEFKVVKLLPEELDKYTGVYASSQIPLKLTISKAGNSLQGQGTGQPAIPLEPAGEHIFKFELGGIVLEFRPEDNSMILKQAGGTFYFKKE